MGLDTTGTIGMKKKPVLFVSVVPKTSVTR